MSTASKWFPYPGKQGLVQVFCFPYSGVGASIYRSWMPAAGNGVAFHPMEWPGRETRHGEPCITHFSQLVASSTQAMLEAIKGPFALFGHSLGGLVAYEVARSLQHHDLQPSMVFVSGVRPPHTLPTSSTRGPLSDDELVERLKLLQGTTPEKLAHPEWRELFFPVLKADFGLFDSYQHTEGATLTCPLHAFSAMMDPIAHPQIMQEWQALSTGPFKLHVFTGDHFFIHKHQQALLSQMEAALSVLVCSLGGKSGQELLKARLSVAFPTRPIG